MRRATAVLGAVLATASLVTGCTSSSGSGKSTTAASRVALPSPATPAPSDAQLWDQSLCSKLDPAKVAKAAGTGRTNVPTAAPARKEVFSKIGAPTFDYCRVALRDGSQAYDVYFGVSAATWSLADWRAYVRAAKSGGHADREYSSGEVKHVDGHDVLVEHGELPYRGLMRVGDRLVAVYAGAVAGYESEQITAALRLVLPLAKQLGPRPSKVDDPACAKADKDAAAALGALPIVARATRDDGVLGCGWATRSSYVRVRADDGPGNWPVVVRSMQRQWPNAEVVNGVGAAAVYTDAHGGEPATVRVATKKRLVFVQGSGDDVSKATLTALVKKVIGYY